ncbi:MAG TPA: lipid II flippase MurJ [Pirellulaceae bacterium]|jgi:putative peptidoglycan lipid II flippase|nr:lipid II flippase MurJ [Pirellulaceae bacterium]
MSDETRRFFRRAGGTGAAAALSRALGMLRDALLAALLGVGDVMDALVTALRLPDLSRRLMQEGALTAEFVPEIARRFEREDDRGIEAASRYLVAVLRLWLVLSVLFLFLAEGATLALFSWGALGTRDELTRRLFAIALPFLPLVVGASLLAGALQAIGRFRAPAFASALLNVVWLAALAFCFASSGLDAMDSATVLAATLTLGGLVQFLMLSAAARQAGLTWREPQAEEKRLALRFALRAPMVAAALLVVPLCMALDGAWAWAASRSEGFPAYAYLPFSENWSRRLAEGAASAAYCSERICMLPVGIAASAIGAVALPAIAAAASRSSQPAVRREWTRALRWATFLAVPAGAGIWFVGGPLSRALFGHGEAGPEAAERIGEWVVAYSFLIPPTAWGGILVRGLAATGALRFAAIWGLACVAAAFVADAVATLEGQELALAWSTSAVAYIHAGGLALYASVRRQGLDPAWIATLFKSAVATGMMLACLVAVRATLLGNGDAATENRALEDALYVAAATLTGGTVYFAASYVLRMTEGQELFAARRVRKK